VDEPLSDILSFVNLNRCPPTIRMPKYGMAPALTDPDESQLFENLD
jgi:hypothetical protein